MSPGNVGSEVAVIVGSRGRSFATDAADVRLFSRVNLKTEYLYQLAQLGSFSIFIVKT